MNRCFSYMFPYTYPVRKIAIIICLLIATGCMFSNPMTFRLATINRNKLLITNGKYCEWASLPKSWKKKGAEKGAVRYYNEEYQAGIGVIVTCPHNGEQRKLEILAGELASSINDRNMVEERKNGGMLWQVWNGKEDGKDVSMMFAVTKQIGCAFDFTLITSTPLEIAAIADFERAVDGFICKENARWK